MLAMIVLSTVAGLIGRSVGAATRLVVALVAITITLTYALFPRLM